ncbi:hypothetical protein DFH07DRAFT_1021347 [Mycena maculata]|uniref:Integrase core domain-containing protein n=1 Tax=Mycena maculata TaxID=230809 RepID=A0AAD7NHM6_9AGAR|nr:hypothetical protein DFH07DRAFT_1021347 [Mycena maculata]
MHKGPGRASFMWGSSTRNTRIERLWVEVGTQFARRWRAFFTRLGRLHQLDRKNPAHLWLLHHLFLDAINDDCEAFRRDWNLHPISGHTTNDQSPADMRFIAQTTEGVYRADKLDGIHPDAINRYLGIEGQPKRRGRAQTEAGHAEDDSDSDEESDGGSGWQDVDAELENRIGEDQAGNIRHAPIKVARHQSPFATPEQDEMFLTLLPTLAEEDVPEDYGVRPDEWDNEPHYPEVEVIRRPGTRGKEIQVVLPREEWYPRAVVWAKALDLLSRIVTELEEEVS